MPTRGEQFLDDAHRVPDFYRIVNTLFRHTDAALTEGFEHVRLGHALETFKRQVANDRQLFDFENDVHAAARTVFSQHASGGFVEESQREQRLVVTLHLVNVVRIARPGLDVIENIVFTQTTIADDVNVLDDSLLLWRWSLLLGSSRSYVNFGDSSHEAQKKEPKRAI